MAVARAGHPGGAVAGHGRRLAFDPEADVRQGHRRSSDRRLAVAPRTTSRATATFSRHLIRQPRPRGCRYLLFDPFGPGPLLRRAFEPGLEVVTSSTSRRTRRPPRGSRLTRTLPFHRARPLRSVPRGHRRAPAGPACGCPRSTRRSRSCSRPGPASPTSSPTSSRSTRAIASSTSRTGTPPTPTGASTRTSGVVGRLVLLQVR